MFLGNVASIMLSLILRHPKYDKIDDEFLCLIEVRLQCIKQMGEPLQLDVIVLY